MCEILGFSAKCGRDINDSLRVFFSHCDEHPNGWGIAGFNGGGGLALLCTEPVRADVSEKLPLLLQKPLEYPTILAHIRKATVGRVCLENCHPFVKLDCSGRQWTLIHNGTIFSGMELVPYLEKQAGDTDSEGILFYLVDRMDKETRRLGRRLLPVERCRAAEGVVARLSRRNKLNLMFFDGELLYVHTNMERTLFCKNDRSGLLFATASLDGDGWVPMPLATLFVYRNGQEVYRGASHCNVYTESVPPPVFEYQI